MVDFFLPRFSMRLTVTREVNGRECLRFNFIYVNLMCLQHLWGFFLFFFLSTRKIAAEDAANQNHETKRKSKEKKKTAQQLRQQHFFFCNKKLPSERITIVFQVQCGKKTNSVCGNNGKNRSINSTNLLNNGNKDKF